jgi:hypothetical protein
MKMIWFRKHLGIMQKSGIRCGKPFLRFKTPSTKTHPNFKVDPFLHHIMKVSMDAWNMGEMLSCDEQHIGFTGRHQDKQHVN